MEDITMTRLTNALYPQTINGTNEKTLDDLYRFLHPTVSRWVYFSNIPAFHGQENDLIQDIIQETIFRFTLYSQEIYVFFPERMALVIAKHFFLDLTRKESRMEHSIPETFPNEKHDFSEEAVNNVYQGQVFTVLAKEIASFPHGQKTALLVDLAWRTDVEDK